MSPSIDNRDVSCYCLLLLLTCSNLHNMLKYNRVGYAVVLCMMKVFLSQLWLLNHSRDTFSYRHTLQFFRNNYYS